MNKTTISKIILAVVLLSLVFVLSGCSADNSDIGQTLIEMLDTFAMTLFGFIAAVISAIVTLLAGIVLLAAGIFGVLSQLVDIIWQFIVGLF